MRLIDKDALIDEIKHTLWDWDSVDGIKSSTVLKQTISDINNMPTIDAVRVVRCKDCQYRDADDFCMGRGYPNMLVPDDGFCEKGARRSYES